MKKILSLVTLVFLLVSTAAFSCEPVPPPKTDGVSSTSSASACSTSVAAAVVGVKNTVVTGDTSVSVKQGDINNDVSNTNTISNGDTSASVGNITLQNNYKRNFANTPNIMSGNVVGYNPDLKNPSFGYTYLKKLLHGQEYFTEGALLSILEKSSVVSRYKVVNSGDDNPFNQNKDARWIKVVYTKDFEPYPGVNDKPVNGKKVVRLNGYSFARSDDMDTTMLEVFAKAALDALKAGCNVYVVEENDFVNLQEAKGLSLGSSYVNAGGSSVGTGGFGYSKAKAYEYNVSYIKGVGIIDHAVTMPE